MTYGVNKTAPGGTRSAGDYFLFLPGTHGPLVDDDRDRKGDDSLHDAEPKLSARNEQNEIVPCRGGSLDRFAGISVIPQHGHFNVAGVAAVGWPTVSTGAVIEVVWALPVVMLVGLVAVVVMVFAGRTVVMATGGIGASGMSESHRAAEKQRQEHCK